VRCNSRRVATPSRSERPGFPTPEVVIKIISPGSNSLAAVRQHLAGLQNRHGRSLETDFFRIPVVGRKAIEDLIDDWDLDLEELLCRVTPFWTLRTTPKKLVHKILFSMPAGTPPDRFLAAVRDFAYSVFAPRHRYAIALHTDEPHPHVHIVLKASGEDGERLQICKATLRDWRKAFADHLRDHGVAAKATTRSSCEKPRRTKLKGIYRPMRPPRLRGTELILC
jgi:Relaxase/Mobilisation nuclease domain